MDIQFVHPSHKLKLHLWRVVKQFVHVVTMTPHLDNYHLWPLDTEKWIRHPVQDITWTKQTWTTQQATLHRCVLRSQWTSFPWNIRLSNTITPPCVQNPSAHTCHHLGWWCYYYLPYISADHPTHTTHSSMDTTFDVSPTLLTEYRGPIFRQFHRMPWPPNGSLASQLAENGTANNCMYSRSAGRNVNSSCLIIFKCLDYISIEKSLLQTGV